MIKTTLFKALQVSTHAMIMSDRNKLIPRTPDKDGNIVFGFGFGYILRDQEIEINNFGVASVRYDTRDRRTVGINSIHTVEVMFVIRTEFAVEEKDFEKAERHNQSEGNKHG